MSLSRNFVNRIVEWNKARYEQDWDSSLTTDLLLEEVYEFVDAPDEVDELDALVDIVFVSIGAMWKMGLSPEQIKQAILIVCDSNDSKTVEKTPSNVKANINKGDSFTPPEEALSALLREVHNSR